MAERDVKPIDLVAQVGCIKLDIIDPILYYPLNPISLNEVTAYISLRQSEMTPTCNLLGGCFYNVYTYMLFPFKI